MPESFDDAGFKSNPKDPESLSYSFRLGIFLISDAASRGILK